MSAARTEDAPINVIDLWDVVTVPCADPEISYDHPRLHEVTNQMMIEGIREGKSPTVEEARWAIAAQQTIRLINGPEVTTGYTKSIWD